MTTTENLLNEIQRLQKEIDFYKSIQNHPYAMVYQLKEKTKKDQKIWVNMDTASLELLESLDQDSEIEELIATRKTIKYHDSR